MIDPILYIRRLIVAVFISGALNIVLIALFFYWSFRESPPTPYYELKPVKQEQVTPLAIDQSNSEVVLYFRKMSVDWLVTRLNNLQLVENGYTQRDLALASLMTFHHFNLERALAGLPYPQQMRTIRYGKFKDGTPADLVVYPNLTKSQYDAIIHYASTERWPLTSKGLFLALRKQEKATIDPFLADAFFMTPEFLSIEMLFGRGSTLVSKNELMEMLLEGDWNLLATFFEKQKISNDLSTSRRQAVLLEYVNNQSKSAAYLLLKTDSIFATRKLDDASVLLLLQLAEDKQPESETFALALLTSPRSDDVWKLAATRLYEYAKEPIPNKFVHHAALSRFMPQQNIIPVDAIALTVPSSSTKDPVRLPDPPKTKPVNFPEPAKTERIKPKEPAHVEPIKSKEPPKIAPTPKLSPAKVNPAVAVQPPLPRHAPIISSKPSSKLAMNTKPPMIKERTYVVQEGDSLWKIARRFNVDIDLLKASNKLDSDKLSPGKTLRIP